MSAAYQGHSHVVDWIVDNGLSAVDVADEVWESLHHACAVVCVLALTSPCLQQARTPLMVAAMQGHVPVVKSLLARGATLEARETEVRLTECVLLVCLAVCFPYFLRQQGWTALFFATGYGHAEVVTELLQAGADATLYDAVCDVHDKRLPLRFTEVVFVCAVSEVPVVDDDCYNDRENECDPGVAESWICFRVWIGPLGNPSLCSPVCVTSCEAEFLFPDETSVVHRGDRATPTRGENPPPRRRGRKLR